MPVTKIKFLSLYRGEAHYEVQDGPMSLNRVSVRGMDEEFYRKEWSGGGPWNMNGETYARDVIGSVGIVNHYGAPVTPDVLAAVNADFDDNRRAHPNGLPRPFCTGEWKEGVGWIRHESPPSVEAEGAPVDRARMRA